MLHLKRSMDRKLPDKKKPVDFLDFLLGTWLLAHDLADRVIHSVNDRQSQSLPGIFLKKAHESEENLKTKIKSFLSELGLATSEDLKEVQNQLDNLMKKRR